MALKQELKRRLGKLKKNTIIDTIYIGGGTPSYINERYIYEILNMKELKTKLKEDSEITIEINPGTISEEKLICYREAGINRISIGLQSTDETLLKKIGRIHNYEEFLNGYKMVRRIGFNNVNVDLMLALPEHNLEVLRDSINKVIDLNPEHISIYSLILEEGTKLFDIVNSGQANLPSEEQEREMYWETKRILEANNYKHYEISNFAKEGYESKHNVNCWEQKEYFGFGVAAHSYYDNMRYSNTNDIEEYIKNVGNSKIVTINEIQNIEDKKKEYMMLGLRKIEGVDLNAFKEKFYENAEQTFKEEIESLEKQKLIILENGNLKLSEKGIDFANQVWEKFV